MRVTRLCIQFLAVCLVSAFISLPYLAQSDDTDINDLVIEAAIRELRTAVSVQRDNRHLDQLRSLRSLHDESLIPFFHKLTDSEDPLIHINGILGLAELNKKSRSIDPWQVSRLGSETNRLKVLTLSIGFDLLGVDEMRDMLAWDDLQEAPRLALLAELVKLRESVDVEQVRKLAESKFDAVRGMASCVLLQITDLKEPFTAYRSRLESLSNKDRLRIQGQLVNDIARYKLDKMLWWIEELINQPNLDSDFAKACVSAAIQLDVEKGMRYWNDLLNADSSYVNVAELGLLLFALSSEYEIPAKFFERLKGAEPLTNTLADAGIALATDVNVLQALKAVLDLDKWRSSVSAFFAAEKLSEEDKVRFYLHTINRAEKHRSRLITAEREQLAVRAVPLLFEIDPAAIKFLLEEIPDDSRKQEVILMGLFASESAEAGNVTRTVKRLGSGRADSLALVLIAKHAAKLSPEEFRDLGAIVRGAGRVSLSIQVQAAWLYLKHAGGKTEFALLKLFGSG